MTLPIGSAWSTPVHDVAPQTVSAAVADVIVATILCVPDAGAISCHTSARDSLLLFLNATCESGWPLKLTLCTFWFCLGASESPTTSRRSFPLPTVCDQVKLALLPGVQADPASNAMPAASPRDAMNRAVAAIAATATRIRLTLRNILCLRGLGLVMSSTSPDEARALTFP